MAVTLVVNPGSISRKYAFYRGGVCLASVHVEGGEPAVACVTTEVAGVVTSTLWQGVTLENALEKTLMWAKEQSIIGSYAAVDTVALRVVAPGRRFLAHERTTADYFADLRSVSYLVPVHIPVVLHEYAALTELLPDTPCFAVSDSAFHATTDPVTRLQSLPGAYERVGYHGLSAAAIARRLPEVFVTTPERTIILHVGGGVSVMALRHGVSVATSMGFVPASGVLMGTRGGDVEAATLAAYLHDTGITPVEALRTLYCESGLKALTGVSDLRLVLERAAAHDSAAVLAVNAFVHQVSSAVSAQILLMGGVDAVILTATAVVRNPALREKILTPLAPLGVHIDPARNDALVGREGHIEAAGSVPIVVLKTDEMGEMARVVDSLQ